MATSSRYYIDAQSFGIATSVYTDVALSTKAPDGIYSIGGIYRRQRFGKLEGIFNCEGEGPGSMRINYIVNLSGGISPGGFDILVGGASVFSSNSNASGFIDVPANTAITVWLYAPVGDTSSGFSNTFYTKITATGTSGIVADSGSNTSNASATITFTPTSDINIQADGSVTTVGEGPQVND